MAPDAGPSKPLSQAHGRGATMALLFFPRWPISSLCFRLCFLLGFVAGLFPFAHRHLHLPLPPSPATVVRGPSSKNTPPPSPPSPSATGREPLLVVVTPTRLRPMQAYYLHRLAHNLRLVPPPLLWLVVDAGAATRETAALLRGCGVMHRHLATPDAPLVRRRWGPRPERAARQRNAALDHIEHHRLCGMVYFADADKVYSLDLFHQLRSTRSFGTWPVAMLTVGKNKTIVEGPVCNSSRVLGWHTSERNKRLQRRFHVNLSGSAFNSSMLWDAKKRAHQAWNYIWLLDTVKQGFQETAFIEQLVEDETHMEGISAGCSKIMNFNLHLEDKTHCISKGVANKQKPGCSHSSLSRN